MNVLKKPAFFWQISFGVILALGLSGLFFWRYFQVSKPLPIDVAHQPETTILSGQFDSNSFKTEDQWRAMLTPDQFHILREAGTEIPFSGDLNHEKRPGTYYSYGCDKPLFRSEQKYDSGTGWPSFWAPVSPDAVVLRQETGGLGDDRIEVLDTCGSHLGHVFDDGPAPTGKRYCMNSLALKFVPDEK